MHTKKSYLFFLKSVPKTFLGSPALAKARILKTKTYFYHIFKIFFNKGPHDQSSLDKMLSLSMSHRL